MTPTSPHPAAYSWEPAGPASGKKDRRSIASVVARTIFGAIALAGLGVGARFAWSEIETRTDEVRQGDSSLGEFPTTTRTVPAQGVEVRVASTESTEDGGTSVAYDARTALATGDMTLDLIVLDGQNVPLTETIEADRLGGAILTYDASSAAWVPGDPFEIAGFAEMTDWMAVRNTLTDVVPVEARPYTTIVETTTETLDVVPLDVGPTASTAGSATPTVPTVPRPGATIPTVRQAEVEVVSPDSSEAADTGDDTTDDVVDVAPAEPTPIGAERSGAVTTTRFRVEIDTVAFAAEEPVAFARWWNSSWSVLGTADVWIDDTGHLRRVLLSENDGSTLDVTWVSLSSEPVDALRSDDQVGS